MKELLEDLINKELFAVKKPLSTRMLENLENHYWEACLSLYKDLWNLQIVSGEKRLPLMMQTRRQGHVDLFSETIVQKALMTSNWVRLHPYMATKVSKTLIVMSLAIGEKVFR